MNPIISTISQRLALGVMTLFLVSIVIFVSVAMLPGDFASAVLGQGATPETVKAFQEELGLNQPAFKRYLDWIGNVLVGDFGTSFAGRAAAGETSSREVIELIAPRLANTLSLAGLAAIIAVPIALTLGLLAALYRNSWFDRLVNSATLATISVPEFFVAYVLVLFLAVKFPIFPAISNLSSDPGLGEWLNKAILPALTLSFVIVAHMMRMTRAAVINLLSSPYVEMAHIKGLTQREVILRHALPNAWAPIANVIALNMAYLIVGVVVVEVVFVYPGAGQIMVDSVSVRDVPVVQATALIFATAFITLNLVADIISIVTNPRLLHPT